MIGNGEELLVEESVAVDQLSTSAHHIRIALIEQMTVIEDTS